MHLLTSLLVVLILAATAIVQAVKDDGELVLVHTIFNHGQKTPDRDNLYPNDPHKNLTYYPYGLGELTNEGKRTVFRIGQALRIRYNGFLDEIYAEDVIYARSTDFNRTKMSLQLVLAGLFPPVGIQTWSVGLSWQPIPFYFGESIFGIRCPSYNLFYQEHETTPDITALYKKYGTIIKIINENSGITVTDFRDVYKLFWCLKNEEELGLKLPEWTKRVYEKPLIDMVVAHYHMLSGNTNLRRVTAGYMLQRIIQDTEAKMNGTLSPPSRKFFIYAGHEFNIAALLITLDIFNQKIPPYGSYLIFEIRKKGSQYGVQILYQDYTEGDTRLLKLPTCDEFCPWEQFLSIIEDYIPPESFCDFHCTP